ncbi:MAG: CinA family nicotinamide mononucleotide deamidase-related protein [Caldilineaceae bacterium]
MPAIIAEIVTTGTEILLGDIVDTNAAWIAQQLREAGVNLYYKTTVGDNEPRVRGVIAQSMQRCDAIIVTGGLGPTVDDITRQAIANATGRTLVLHEGALETLKQRFERFGSQLTENNIQQAYVPQDSVLIENPIGTAPGFIVETERCAVIALPGVPREMKRLMADTVLPYLRRKAGETGVIRRRILRTLGIGESTIDVILDDLMHASNPTTGLAAHTGQCDIRIAARAETAEEAEALLDGAEATIRQRMGEFIYSTTPGESYETVVVSTLLAPAADRAGISLAVVESNTRGALAERLAKADPQYNPVLLQQVLSLEQVRSAFASAQSAPLSDSQMMERTAAASAQEARHQAGATIGLALIGTAGSDEGVFGTQSGETWLALVGEDRLETARLRFGGSDDYTTVRIGNDALRKLAQFVA